MFNKINKDLTLDKDVEICYINKQNNKINQLLKQIRKDKEKNDYIMSNMNLKILNINEKSIQNLIDKSIKNNSILIFSLFGKSNTHFINSIEFLEKISPFE